MTSFIGILFFISLPLVLLLTLVFPSLGLAILIIPTRFSQISEVAGLEYLSPKYFIVGAFLLIVAYRIVLRKNSFKIDPAILAIFLSLLFVTSFSLVYTDNFQYGIEKLTEFLIVTAVSFLAPFIFLNSAEKVESFFKWTVYLAGVLGSLFLLLGSIFSFRVLFATIGGNYLAIGHFMSLALLLIIYWIPKRNIKKGILWFLATAVVISALVVSGGKGPIVAFVMAVVFSTIFSIKFYSVKILINLIFRIFTVLVLIILITISPLGKNLVQRSLEFLSPDSSSRGIRIETAHISWEMFQESPVWGQGLGSFELEFGDKFGPSDIRYPHNIFLEFLAETGLVGLVLFLVLVFHSVWILVSMRLRGLAQAIFAIFIFVLFSSVLSGNINNQAFFLVLGLIQTVRINDIM